MADDTKKNDLAPLPKDHEDEERRALALAQENVARLSLIDPERVELLIKSREKSLELLRVASIKQTNALDWTLYKDRDGREVAVLRDSGAVRVRKLMGISIFNYRPTTHGYPTPEVTEEARDGATVRIVTMWADGMCALTGEAVEGVYFAVRSDDDFIGRQRKTAKGEEFVSLQDQTAACRTGIDAKITRILSGMRKVPVELLVGVDLAKTYKGHGYGTSSERGAAKVAEEGVPEQAAKLRDEILKRVGGDTAAAKQLCRDITKAEKPGKDGKVFPGFETVDRLTAVWQIEAALKRLKAHPTFGDAREAGQEG